MFEYKISNIQPLPENVLNNGIYILILHAKRIPPHLALVIDGKVFSLSVNGPKINGKINEIISMIQSKTIKTLFFKLSDREDYTVQQLVEKMKELTLAHPGLDAGRVTCLTPVKEFCHAVYKTDITGVNFIFDLLPKLYERSLVSGCFHLNMKEFLNESAFYLKKYTVKDINNMIKRLQPATRNQKQETSNQ